MKPTITLVHANRRMPSANTLEQIAIDEPGITALGLADRYGVALVTVYRQLRRCGIRLSRAGRQAPPDVELRELMRTETLDDLAARFAGQAQGRGSSVMENTILEGVDPQALLRVAVHAAGGQSAFARKHGISSSYVSNVLADRRGFGGDLLAVLGCERVAAVVRKNDYDAWLEPAPHDEGIES
ncbi:MAG: hypothetical protein ACOH2M_01310 [Cypionkella sp.]